MVPSARRIPSLFNYDLSSHTVPNGKASKDKFKVCVTAYVSTENLIQETGKSQQMFKKTDFQLRNLMCSEYRIHHNLRLHHSEVAVTKMTIRMVTEF